MASDDFRNTRGSVPSSLREHSLEWQPPATAILRAAERELLECWCDSCDEPENGRALRRLMRRLS